jgi:hypothetical protein
MATSLEKWRRKYGLAAVAMQIQGYLINVKYFFPSTTIRIPVEWMLVVVPKMTFLGSRGFGLARRLWGAVSYSRFSTRIDDRVVGIMLPAAS